MAVVVPFPLVPSPSWPYSLDPQQYALPEMASTPQVWLKPAVSNANCKGPEASRTPTSPRGATSDSRVGVTVRVADPAGVGVMVTVDVTVAVSVDVSVGVVVADPAGVGVAVAVDVTVAVRETNPLRVGVAVAETDGGRTGEAVTDAKTVAVVVSVNQGAGTGVMVVPGTMPATVAGDACNAVGTGMGVAVAIA